MELELILQKLRQYQNLMSSEHVKDVYESENFMDEFIPFAIHALQSIPISQTRFDVDDRSYVLKILLRIKYRETVPNELLHILMNNVMCDTLYNRLMSINIFGIILKKCDVPWPHIEAIIDILGKFITDIRTIIDNDIEKQQSPFSELIYTLGEIATFILFLSNQIKNNHSEKSVELLGNVINQYEFFCKNIIEFKDTFRFYNDSTIELLTAGVKILPILINFYEMLHMPVIFSDFMIFLLKVIPDELFDLKIEAINSVKKLIIEQRESFRNELMTMINNRLFVNTRNVDILINVAEAFFEIIKSSTAFRIDIAVSIHNLTIEIFQLSKIQMKRENYNTNYFKEFLDKNSEFMRIYSNPSSEYEASVLKNILMEQLYANIDCINFVSKNYKNKINCINKNGSKCTKDENRKSLIKAILYAIRNLFDTIRRVSAEENGRIELTSTDIRQVSKLLRIFIHNAQISSNIWGDIISIFIYFSDQCFRAVLKPNIPILIKFTQEDHSLFDIWKFFLNYQPTSIPFAIFTLDFLNSNFKTIQNSKFLVTAYDLTIKALLEIPHERGKNIFSYIKFILETFMSYSSDQIYQHRILLSLFKHLQPNIFKFPSILRLINDKVKDIFIFLDQLIDTFPEESLYVELALNIPVTINFVLINLKYVLNPILVALNRSPKLQSKALLLLEMIFENIQAEHLNESCNYKMIAIMKKLNRLMEEKEIQLTIIRIIARLKTFVKKYLHHTYITSQNSTNISYSTYLMTNNHETLEKFDKGLQYKLSSDDFEIRLDEILMGAINNLSLGMSDMICNYSRSLCDIFTFKDLEVNNKESDKQASVRIILGFLYHAMGFSNFREHYIDKRTIKHLKNLEKSGYKINFLSSYLSTYDSIKTHFYSKQRIALTKTLNIKQFVYDMIVALFWHLKYETQLEQKQQKNKYLMKNNIEEIKPDAGESKISTPTDEIKEFLKHVYNVLAIYKIIESYKLGDMTASVHFDYSPLIDALVAGFASTRFAQELLLMMYETMIKICGSKILVMKTLLFNDILQKFISCCYFKSWSRLSVAYTGIVFLLKNIDLGSEFIDMYQEKILDAIFFLISNSHLHSRNEINDLITYLFRIRNTQIQKDSVVLLIKNLSNKNEVSRELSTFALKYISKIQGISLADLLKNHEDTVLKFTFNHYFKSCNRDSLIGMIEGAKFVIIQNPPINFNKQLFAFINIVIELIKEYHNSSYHNYLIITCYSFLHATMSYIKDVNEMSNVLNLLCSGLISSDESVAEICKKAIKLSLIQNESLTSKIIKSQSSEIYTKYLSQTPDNQLYTSIGRILDIVNTNYHINIIERTVKLLSVKENIIKALEILSLLVLPETVIVRVVDIYLQLDTKVLSSEKMIRLLLKINDKNTSNLFSILFSYIDNPLTFNLIEILLDSYSLKKYIKENIDFIKESAKKMMRETKRNPYGLILLMEKIDALDSELLQLIIAYYYELRVNLKNSVEIREIIQKNIPKLDKSDFEILLTKLPDFIIDNIECIDLNKIDKRFAYHIIDFITICECSSVKEKNLNTQEIINPKLHSNKLNTKLQNEKLKKDYEEYKNFENICSFLENILTAENYYFLLPHFYRIGHKSSKIMNFLRDSPIEKIYLSRFKSLPIKTLLFLNPEYKNLLLESIENSELEPRIILSTLQKDLFYKTHLFIIYPLISNNVLMTPEIFNECLDATYRLFITGNEVHLRIGVELLKTLSINSIHKSKDEVLIYYPKDKIYDSKDKNTISMSKAGNAIDEEVTNESIFKYSNYINFSPMIKSLYGMYFSRCCHMDNLYFINQLEKFSMEMDLNYVEITPEKLVYTSFIRSLLIEIRKEHSEEYQKQLLNRVYPFIKTRLTDQLVDLRLIDKFNLNQVIGCIAFQIKKFSEYSTISLLFKKLNDLIEKKPGILDQVKYILGINNRRKYEVEKKDVIIKHSDQRIEVIKVRTKGLQEENNNIATYKECSFKEENINNKYNHSSCDELSSKRKSDLKTIEENMELSDLNQFLSIFLANIDRMKSENIHELLKFMLITECIDTYLFPKFLEAVSSDFIKNNFNIIMSCNQFTLEEKISFINIHPTDECLELALDNIIKTEFIIDDDYKKNRDENNLFKSDDKNNLINNKGYNNIRKSEDINYYTKTEDKYDHMKNSNFLERRKKHKYKEIDMKNPTIFNFIMNGLKSRNTKIRRIFYDIFVSQLPTDFFLRLKTLLEIDWNESVSYVLLHVFTNEYYLGIKTNSLYSYRPQQKLQSEHLPTYFSENTHDLQSIIKDYIPSVISSLDKLKITDFWPYVLDMLFFDEDLSKRILIKICRARMQNLDNEEKLIIINILKDKELFRNHLIEMAEFFEIDIFSRNRYGSFIDIQPQKFMNLYESEIFDRDFHYAKLKRIAKSPITTKSIELAQKGNYQESMKLLEENWKNTKENDEVEIEIWTKEWIGNAKQLQHWDTLNEVANTIGNHELACDSIFRLKNLMIASERMKFKQINEGNSNKYRKKLYENIIDLHESPNEQNIKNFLKHNLRRFLQSSSFNKNRELLYLQIAYEMLEAVQIFKSAESNDPSLFLYGMSQRVQKSTDIELWSDLFAWKIHLNNKAATIDPDSTQEITNLITQFGMSLLKNHLYESAIVTNAYLFNMTKLTPDNVFSKIQIDSEAYMNMKMHDAAINILESACTDQLTSLQHATLISLKGRCLLEIDKIEEAEEAFMQSFKIEKTLGENWYRWGCFLEAKKQKHYSEKASKMEDDDYKSGTSPQNNSQEPFIYETISNQISNNINDQINNTQEKFSNHHVSPGNVSQFSEADLNTWKAENDNKYEENSRKEIEELCNQRRTEKNKQPRKKRKNHAPIDYEFKLFLAFLQAVIYLPVDECQKAVIKTLKYTKEKSATKLLQNRLQDLEISRFLFHAPKLIDQLIANSPAELFLKSLMSKYPQSLYLQIKNHLPASQSTIEKKSFIEGKNPLNGLSNIEENAFIEDNLIMSNGIYHGESFSRDDLCGNILNEGKRESSVILYTLEQVTNLLLLRNRHTLEEKLHNNINRAIETTLCVYSGTKSIDDILKSLNVVTNLFLSTIFRSEPKRQFITDLYTRPLELHELVEVLLKWKNFIETICQCSPIIKTRNIPHMFNYDKTINFYELYTFNQMNKIRNGYSDLVKINSFEPFSQIYWKSNKSRNFYIRGSDGKRYLYLFRDRDNDRIRELSHIIDHFGNEKMKLQIGTPFSLKISLFNFDHLLSTEDICDGYGLSNFDETPLQELKSRLNDSKNVNNRNKDNHKNDNGNNHKNDNGNNHKNDNEDNHKNGNENNNKNNYTNEDKVKMENYSVDSDDSKNNKKSDKNLDSKTKYSISRLSTETFRSKYAQETESSDTVMIIIEYLKVLYKLADNREIKIDSRLNMNLIEELEKRLSNAGFGIYQKNTYKTTKLSISQLSVQIKPLDFHISDENRYESFEIISRCIGNSILKDFFSLTYNDLIEYLDFLKYSITSLILQSRYLYFVNVYDRQPMNIDFSIHKGIFYNSEISTGIQDLPMRLTPNITGLYGLHLTGRGLRLDFEFQKLVSKHYDDLFEIYGIGNLKRLNDEILNESTDRMKLSKMKIIWQPWF